MRTPFWRRAAVLLTVFALLMIPVSAAAAPEDNLPAEELQETDPGSAVPEETPETAQPEEGPDAEEPEETPAPETPGDEVPAPGGGTESEVPGTDSPEEQPPAEQPGTDEEAEPPAVPEIPAGWTSPFPDVTESDWFLPYVAAVSTQGIMMGSTDGTFMPLKNISFGEAVLMMVRAVDGVEPEAPQDAHYATGAVRHAVSRGWLEEDEVPEDLNSEVSRLFIARLTVTALDMQRTSDSSPYADTADPAALALYDAGIMVGTVTDSGRLFNPDSMITRSEIAAAVWRITNWLESTPKIQFGSETVRVLPGVPKNELEDRLFEKGKDGRLTYSGKDFEVQTGVSVSQEQGKITWSRVKSGNADFAMIRCGVRESAGEEGIKEDERFVDNLTGASEAGMPMGITFLSRAVSVEEAEQEADFVLQYLTDFPLEMPVAFEWDASASRTKNVDSGTLTEIAGAFCGAIETAGFDSMVCLDPATAYTGCRLNALVDYPLWLSRTGDRPDFYYAFDMWKYTDKGKVNGISGSVDLSIRVTKK